MSNLISYTKEFSMEREFNHRLLQQKYAGRLDKLADRKERHIEKAEDHELGSGLFRNARARRQYRKADKAQRAINRINHKIARSEERLNRHAIDVD